MKILLSKKKIFFIFVILLITLGYFLHFRSFADPLDRMNPEDINPTTSGVVIEGVNDNYYDNEDKKMSDEEILKNYDDMRSMFKEIFSLSDDATGNPFFNPTAMMTTISSSVIGAVQGFGESSTYRLFLGFGIFFMFINYMLNFNLDKKNNETLTPEQMFRETANLIVIIVVIANLSRICVAFLQLFNYILNNVIGLVGESGSSEASEFVDKALISIVRKNGADRISSGIGSITGMFSGEREEGILDNILNAINIMFPRIQFMIPWVIALFGKFGCIFAIFGNAIELYLHCMVLPMSMYDISDNVKHSRGIAFFKKILALALQQSIIILTMVAVNSLMMNFLGSISGSIADNTFTCACTFAVFHISKMAAINVVSKAVANAVFGG